MPLKPHNLSSISSKFESVEKGENVVGLECVTQINTVEENQSIFDISGTSNTSHVVADAFGVEKTDEAVPNDPTAKYTIISLLLILVISIIF